VKLLRAIQEGEVEPVGARKSVKADVRIVSATNRDLIADVKSGRFREDLFYRLHVFPITVPPLRKRTADVPALARHFLARFSAEEGKRIRFITPEALRLLAAFPWPGNIRQLENTLFRGVVLADGDSLGLAEFPQIAAQVSGQSALQSPPAASDEELAHDIEPEVPSAQPVESPSEDDATEATPTERLMAAQSTTLLDALALLDETGEVRPLEEVEAELIRYAITHYRGQMSEVARRLRIGRSTLYRKLESLGLNSEQADTDEDSVAGERQPRKIA
jgi:DNA-binding NtrC family response regulator